ncbi:MAG: 6-phosphogluconolactonase [Bacteroidales bacterium]
METFVFPDKNALAEGAGLRSGAILHPCRRKRLRSPSLALSGGSTPWGCSAPWSQARPSILGRRPGVLGGRTMRARRGDERSNYGTARRRFLEPLGCRPNDFSGDGREGTRGRSPRRYETLLGTTLPLEEGVPVFDWIWLGLGEDGHTVSVFPHQIGLWDDPGCCAVARHPVLPEMRITLTGRVINAARRVTFLVTGAAKAERVRDIIRGNGDGPRVPAALVNPRWGKLEFYMDREAASKL